MANTAIQQYTGTVVELSDETPQPAGTASPGNALKASRDNHVHKAPQVLAVTKTDTFSSASTSWVDITDLELSITPQSVNSKVLISANIARGNSVAGVSHFRIVRDGVAIGVGDAASNRNQVTKSVYWGNGDPGYHIGPVLIDFLDEPASASEITYKIQVKSQAINTTYINRSSTDEDSANTGHRDISTMILTEVFN